MNKTVPLLTLVFTCALAYPSALSNLAASMKAGDWAQLSTVGAAAALGSTGGSTGNILPYSDDMQWDPDGHTLYFIGSDHQHATGYPRFVAYSESTNTWTTKPRPTWFPSLTETAMHGYDHSAIDPSTGTLYHSAFIKNGGTRVIRPYDLKTGSWRTSFASPNYSACCIGIDFFPEYHGLIFADGGSSMIYGYKPADNSWHTLKTGATMGDYHNVTEYNPKYKVMIGGAGNSSTNLYKIDSTGAVTTLKNAPLALRPHQTLLTVDPVGGDYLVFDDSKIMRTYDVSTDTWSQESGTAPIYTTNGDGPITNVVATPVSTYGVTAFVSCNGSSTCWVSLYKRTAMPVGAESKPGIEGPAGLFVSPNPVRRLATVRVKGLQAAKCTVADVRGRVIWTLRADTEGTFVLDATGLAAGLYLVRAAGGAKIMTQKIFVQK